MRRVFCNITVFHSYLLKARGPDVIMGDFNALRRADYSAERWDEIAERRTE